MSAPMSHMFRSGKLYYSIGEASEIAGLPQSVLRYWETEFKGVRPPRNRAGKRLYRQADIDRIKEIKKLLYEDRFTIEGARKILSERDAKKRAPIRGDSVAVQKKENGRAEDIRRGLKEILEILKG